MPVPPPYFFNHTYIDPKRKYKFITKFEGGLINSLYPNDEYIWFIKSCTKPRVSLATKAADDEETRTFFGNVPDSSKRMLGQPTWQSVTIKMINPFSHTFKPLADDLGTTNTEEVPIPDIDDFMSRIIKDIDPAQGGGSIYAVTHASNGGTYNTKLEAIGAYYNSIADAADATKFTRLSSEDQYKEAASSGFKTGGVSSATKSDLSQTNCKSISDISKRASCSFAKYFGMLRIYDMGNGYYTYEEARQVLSEKKTDNTDPLHNVSRDTVFTLGDTFVMGYWSLQNPWIVSIDNGSHEYSTDDLQEYTIEIGYESAKYYSLMRKDAVQEMLNTKGKS